MGSLVYHARSTTQVYEAEQQACRSNAARGQVWSDTNMTVSIHKLPVPKPAEPKFLLIERGDIDMRKIVGRSVRAQGRNVHCVGEANQNARGTASPIAM